MTLRYGTRLEFADGLLVGVSDRHGRPQAALAWEDRSLVALEATLSPRTDAAVLVRGDRVPHVLFGAAHPVMTSQAGSEPVTWMGAIDWARPEVIPELMKLTGGRRIVPVIVDAAGIHVAPAGGSAF